MTQPTPEQLRMARECAAQIAQRLRDHDYAGWIRDSQKDSDSEVQSALLAIQATEARMAEAVEEERERLIGQVSVDIEIALNKAGVLLTEAQGYIAAEAALAAIRSQSNG